MKGASFTPHDTAAPVAEQKPAAKPARKGKTRAREDDGQFKSDDPSTPDTDEAWVEPKE
ncbi:hypothetical protein [Pseudomonas sp.]|uniref:hypothetical protein n=1 Tax=Pseudomonas sp. TaxID=306 RepID=UPI002582CD26|nr:hypothetical protein [Pseudomonas sp.]